MDLVERGRNEIPIDFIYAAYLMGQGEKMGLAALTGKNLNPLDVSYAAHLMGQGGLVRAM